MLKISANDAQLTVVACGPITSDRIDLPCEITLSPEFDGLAVTVVFKAGDVQRDVAMLGSPVHVPVECLEQAGEVLMVGIWAGDGSGRPTIPTVWASAGTIRTGVLPSGYDPDEPEPDWAAQVQQAAANAVATANSVRADADAGAFDGADGYSPTAIVEQLADGATITITDKDGTTTATVHDGADGRDGRDGTDGVDGYSPTATVTQTATGATISITDKSGTTTASVSNGTDGTDGTDGFSPTVDVQAITGGHEVTITDADGAHSFEVMDGDPAEPGSITDAMLAPDGIKAQVASMWGNQLTGELSGTVDTADDAYAAPPMALTVDGASTQVMTTGKNLWDDARYASVGWSLGTGSMYHGGIKAFCDGITDLGGGVGYPENTQVTICLDIVKTGSTGSIKLRFDYTDGTSSDTSNISNTSYHMTYTSDAGKTVSAARITTNAGVTNASFWFGHIQVGVGVNPSAYETYSGGNASPSPDYPQEIASVCNPSMVPCGKNLLDPSSIEQGAILAGDDFAYANRCRTNARIPTRAGSDIVLTGSSSSGTLQYAAAFYKGGIFEASSGSWMDSGQAITVPSNVDECRFTFRNSDDSDIAPSDLSNIQLELGSTATAYEPYQGTTVPLYDGTLRSLPDGTKDTLALTYLRPSTREGWAWYQATLTALVGETTTAATDGITGTIGVDVMSTTGEIADGPTVLYKLASAQTTTLNPIELPELPAPTCTVWCDGGSAQPTYSMQYVQDTSLVIADLRAALADLATS